MGKKYYNDYEFDIKKLSFGAVKTDDYSNKKATIFYEDVEQPIFKFNDFWFTFGIAAEKVYNGTDLTGNFKLSVAPYVNHTPQTESEKTTAKVLNGIRDAAINHILKHKTSYGISKKWTKELIEDEVKEIVWRKKDKKTSEILTGDEARTYIYLKVPSKIPKDKKTKEVIQDEVTPKNIIAFFMDKKGNDINASTLEGQKGKVQCFIKFKSVFKGGKGISIQLELYQAIYKVEKREKLKIDFENEEDTDTLDKKLNVIEEE